jgi:predicted NodU family carbamoyl transferase
VHVLREESGPLAELLAIHRQRTGVPALANLPLCAPDDVAAVSPRDAVRAAFASSADALVIHRFVVMKDYWQMRDES